ncbi:MAG: AAA family ATPase [Bacteriovoracaceae bacterium]|nr:AAA family ATPase [Bacteriovoracaceae bacterium]
MSHIRKRFLLDLIVARLKISPIVAIQGARQTGKSLLARELIKEKVKAMSYRTLDKKSDRDFAKNNPDSFLAQVSSNELMVIDEVQKAPDLFDALKASVDENRRPGRFLILGSTEFSTMQRIRESLTGRMSRIRLNPFSISESLKRDKFQDWNFQKIDQEKQKSFPCNRNQLMKYLDRGGMPGHFYIREDDVRNQLMRDWLEMTVQRDLMQIPKMKLDPELAFAILEKIASIDTPSATEISKQLSTSVKKVQLHLKALASLFVVTPIEPYLKSTGKTIWFLVDTSFVKLLGGKFKRQLQTWLLNEFLVSNSMRKIPRKINFYRNSKGSMIDFILSEEGLITGIQIFDRESIYDRDLNLLRSFGQKFKKSALLALAGGRQDHPKENLFVRPWEWMG